MNRIGLWMVVAALAALPAVAAEPGAEIDQQVWAVLKETVLKDDIVGMGRVYLPDAVVVTPKGTSPIRETLVRWGRDMETAKARGDKATVEFRFTSRQDGPTTAFETGLFCYTVIEKNGTRKPIYVPFEQLLAKVKGKWLILMERQLAAVTKADWDKLKP